KESGAFAFSPRCQKHSLSLMPAGDGSQPFAILGRRTGRVAAFDLNKVYLKSIAPFHFIEWSAVRFSYCDQINDTARLLPSRTGETDKVPSRKWCAGQCLPNGYLCHCDRPTLRPSCNSPAVLVVSFSHSNHPGPYMIDPFRIW